MHGRRLLLPVRRKAALTCELQAQLCKVQTQPLLSSLGLSGSGCACPDCCPQTLLPHVACMQARHVLSSTEAEFAKVTLQQDGDSSITEAW
jgi:hypothetical protein